MPAILAFEKISKRFGAVVVARALDLALAEGEALGIIGPNGAGKTTLFGIASGTVAPDAGRVIFAGIDVTRLAPERRCRLGIGRSFQIPLPFAGMSVLKISSWPQPSAPATASATFTTAAWISSNAAGLPTRRTAAPAVSP